MQRAASSGWECILSAAGESTNEKTALITLLAASRGPRGLTGCVRTPCNLEEFSARWHHKCTAIQRMVNNLKLAVNIAGAGVYNFSEWPEWLCNERLKCHSHALLCAPWAKAAPDHVPPSCPKVERAVWLHGSVKSHGWGREVGGTGGKWDVSPAMSLVPIAAISAHVKVRLAMGSRLAQAL